MLSELQLYVFVIGLKPSDKYLITSPAVPATGCLIRLNLGHLFGHTEHSSCVKLQEC